MPLALTISSHVAASHVGGAARASALSILQLDTMVLPTVPYGRHPLAGALVVTELPIVGIAQELKVISPSVRLEQSA